MAVSIVAQPTVGNIRGAFHASGDPGPRPSWRKWPHVADAKRAAVALENILATTSPHDLTAPHISHIVTGYGLSRHHARKILLGFWGRAVAAAVADDLLTDEEMADLTALRFALQICEDDAMATEKAIIHPRFMKSVSEALADDTLTPEEKASLEKLATGLRFTRTDMQLLYAPEAGKVVHRKLDQILEDHRVSPDELAALGQKGEELGLTVQPAQEAKAAITRYAEFWKIENGEVPVLSVPLNLQNGETCAFSTPAQWHELRRMTTRTNLGSIGYSFRIAKGVYYRSPRLRMPSVTTDVLKLIDSGTLYITTKRVIFDGALGNKSLRLSSLLGFTPYSDGVGLEKSTGRSPTITFRGDVERAHVILGAVLARA